MGNEQMNLLVECENCKEKFNITSGNEQNTITHKKEFSVNGKSIFLTYYDCPSCGRRHFVQIDNATTLRKLRDVSKQFAKLTIAKRKGKQISKEQSEKFKKTRKNLTESRMILMREYTGKLIHDNETDSDFVLRFSI